MGKIKTKWIEFRLRVGRVEPDLEIQEIEISPVCSKNGGSITPQRSNKREVCFRFPPPGGVYQCRIIVNHQGRTQEHTTELILNARKCCWNWKNLPPILDRYYQISFHTTSAH